MFRRSKIPRQLSVDWRLILEGKKRRARHPHLQSFYGSCLKRWAGLLAETPFVALDFETTGLDPQENDIISIGVVPFDIERIKCGNARQWLVNPEGRLVEESVVYHRITHSAIEDAPALAGVLNELLAELTGNIIVVHSHKIERTFLGSAFRACFGEDVIFPVIDTMAIEDAIQRGGIRSFWRKLQGKAPISVRLADSRERYGLPAYQLHHALTDALATAELFQAQVGHHYSASTPLAELAV